MRNLLSFIQWTWRQRPCSSRFYEHEATTSLRDIGLCNNLFAKCKPKTCETLNILMTQLIFFPLTQELIVNDRSIIARGHEMSQKHM